MCVGSAFNRDTHIGVFWEQANFRVCPSGRHKHLWFVTKKVLNMRDELIPTQNGFFTLEDFQKKQIKWWKKSFQLQSSLTWFLGNFSLTKKNVLFPHIPLFCELPASFDRCIWPRVMFGFLPTVTLQLLYSKIRPCQHLAGVHSAEKPKRWGFLFSNNFVLLCFILYWFEPVGTGVQFCFVSHWNSFCFNILIGTVSPSQFIFIIFFCLMYAS